MRRNPKIVVVVITTGEIHPACEAALREQDFPVEGVIVSKAAPERRSDDPTRNKYLNCSANRNQARSLALRYHADRFLFLDDDVALPRGGIRSLASHRLPVVGGWYRMKHCDLWVAGRWVADHTFLNFRGPEPQRSVVRTDMVGLGCALIAREALEQIEFEDGMDRSCLNPSGERMLLGECLAFGNRAADLGIPLYMDGSVKCEHLEAHSPSSVEDIDAPAPA